MRIEPITVPVPKPYTRVPIKPAVRHKDKKDRERAPKHKKQHDQD